MTSPTTFAKWAEEALPKCAICRGMGYAYFRADPPPFNPHATAPVMPAFLGRCECARATPPESDGGGR